MVAGNSSKMVTVDDDKDGAPKKLIKGNNNNELPSSVTCVISNCDLLLEILLRLPVLSLILFKSVSKNWLSLIISPDFILRHRSENLNIDPPFGLIIPRITFGMKMFQYNLQSFDIRVPSKKSIRFTLGSGAPLRGVDILQSCNGLLLGCIYDKLCVYNPTINQLKMIPTKLPVSSPKMAFDPAKSPHYKIIECDVVPGGPDHSIQLHTYSSKTSSWSDCSDHFPIRSFNGFIEGVYWNDAIHWLDCATKMTALHIKLDVANERLVLTELEFPVTCDGKSHFESKLFESRGCLLLLGKDYAQSRQLNVYEMKIGYSEWLVKYVVNLDNIWTSVPRSWSIRPCVWSIVLGKRGEDSIIIIDLLNKVVQYNPVSKTLHTLNDLESIGSPSMVSNVDGFHFIPSFAGV